MLPKILKNFNVYVDGRGYAGRVDELTLPKLTIKTDEYQWAGMSAPVEIDMGLEKLEMDLTFSDHIIIGDNQYCLILFSGRLSILPLFI